MVQAYDNKLKGAQTAAAALEKARQKRRKIDVEKAKFQEESDCIRADTERQFRASAAQQSSQYANTDVRRSLKTILRSKQGREKKANCRPERFGVGRTRLFRGVRNHRTFYGNWRGSRAVRGFKLSLYIEVIIYRLVTSLNCSSGEFCECKARQGPGLV